ncbi:large terminase [Leifsonia sp. ZF2019]|uniref:phage terminase family protein n=1 Tax=Leifsonia sp. ZF2019 TaxID=2781978 RepID=UPI001CBD6FC3|nr:phage terminase family protein [Leifsonia sp. ZF2019]UAJ79954.1 large terminase [Leifsonia sp. ZF2019]
MATLIVPPLDLQYPTLGPALADFIEDRCVFGPGSLAGQPAHLDAEKRAALYRLYEVYPKGHRLAGRRRFQRGAIEWRKGMAKTEFAAWIAFCELHPDAPVRGDGFDAFGNPVGKPVAFPYIPMMAVTEEQVSELAYGVLKYVIEEGADADLFDSSLERILRINTRGIADGRVVPVSNSPGSRDGALTTFQHFDEPHRLYLPSAKNAHETMSANLTKRPLEDPWALYTSTAGKPGQGSIQEDVRAEAEMINRGEIDDPALFFFARWAGDEHNELEARPAAKGSPAITPAEALQNRVAAIADATGPVGEYGPGQFESIAKQWDRPKADKAYLERVWLNRWRKSGSQFFDIQKIIASLADPGKTIPKGAFITLGFDGARFRDATALVATDIATGVQELLGLWERPEDADEAQGWEVPEDEVTQTLEHAMSFYEVWKLYGDPPHWTETMGSWSAKWPDQVEEFWTNKYVRMAYTLREYVEAIDIKSVRIGGIENPDGDFDPHDDFLRHLGNAGVKELRVKDDEGKPLLVMAKQEGHQELKFDVAMAAVLSWKACADARRLGTKPKAKRKAVIRRLK